MKQSGSLITLGVADYPRAKAFYEALGWKVALDVQETAFFEGNGVVLVLWGRDKLAADAVGLMFLVVVVTVGILLAVVATAARGLLAALAEMARLAAVMMSTVVLAAVVIVMVVALLAHH